MLVLEEFVKSDPHGATPCHHCHGGDPGGQTRKDAHAGLVRDPTWPDATGPCAGCHPAIASAARDSLHATLAGIRRAVAARAGGEPLSPPLDGAFRTHCSSCHASCGDCHVSSPAVAGGGLLQGHIFVRTPPMDFTCVGCHGSRVRNEYKGLNGTPADVHYTRKMSCTACHTGGEMHGEAGKAGRRYEVENAPRCEGCHPDDAAFRSVAAHVPHRDASDALRLDCRVCHGVEYRSCSGCHVSTDPEGWPVFEVNAATGHPVLGLKIGRNPTPDHLHPAAWVLVRHAPADRDTFAFYGDGLLPAFDSEPTWHLATPHTVRRKTVQNADCTSSCHSAPGVFLLPADIAPGEEAGNAGVVAGAAPP